MATFYGGNLAGPTEMTDMLAGGLKVAEDRRTLEQKRKFERVFQDNLDAEGNLNEKGFYKSGVAAGLNPDQLREAARYHLEQTKTGTEIANNQALQRVQGYDPASGGRNQAGYGKPEMPVSAGAGNSGVVNENTIDADKLRSPSEVGSKTTGVPTTSASIKTGEASAAGSGAPAPSAPVTEPKADGALPTTIEGLKQYFAEKSGKAAPTATAVAQPDGTISGEMSVTAPAPEQWKQPEQPDWLASAEPGTPPVMPEENRSWIQKFEDSFNPALSPQARLGVAQEAASTPDPEMFKWDTRNSGNEFQQYSAAQQQYLNSVGKQDAGSWLKEVYDNELRANAPKPPNPYAFVGANGPDMKAYGESITGYTQGLQQAAGKAAQAVQAEKRKLFELADKQGTQTNTSKRFASDMRGRLKGEIPGSGGIVRKYDVSETEKSRGDVMAQGYQDVVAGYKSGQQLGGDMENKFATDYGAATAAARANGTLNEDAIISNLVSMGAVPNASAVVLRQALAGQGGNLSAPGEDFMRWVRGNAYKGANSEQKRELWYRNTLNNIKQGMATVGYGIEGDATIEAAPSETSTTPAAKPTAKDVLTKEHAAKRAAKKSGKPGKATKADPLGLGI